MPSKEITTEEYKSLLKWISDKQGTLLMNHNRFRNRSGLNMDRASLIYGWSVDDEPIILIHEFLEMRNFDLKDFMFLERKPKITFNMLIVSQRHAQELTNSRIVEFCGETQRDAETPVIPANAEIQ